ncbi:hypothetical protein E2562_014736 [Oryza meyeriana var. granulata]|uniref:Uncharacterized protein n=1 Tax=Oryza meyeriana var. granulata TaxID=110450 RepID=A0A6G1BKT2_9ORYZ|nr:hypothetical protein E2562_014736 [Oryza meyeriana var. granulata]
MEGVKSGAELRWKRGGFTGHGHEAGEKASPGRGGGSARRRGGGAGVGGGTEEMERWHRRSGGSAMRSRRRWGVGEAV